jgi:hypothetical protein
MAMLFDFLKGHLIDPLREDVRGQIAAFMDRLEVILSDVATRELRRRLYGDAAVAEDDDEGAMEEEKEDADAPKPPVAVDGEVPWWKSMVVGILKPMLTQVMGEMINDFRDEMVKAIRKTDFQLEVNVIEMPPPPQPPLAEDAADVGAAETSEEEEAESPPTERGVVGGGRDEPAADEEEEAGPWEDPFPYEQMMH